MVTKMGITRDLLTLKPLVSGLPTYIFVKVMVTEIKIDLTLSYLKSISIRVARIVVGFTII